MTQFLTASFALRPPNAGKQRVLQYAMRNYDQAAQELLDWCELHLREIKANGRVKRGEEVYDKWTGDTVRKCLPSLASIRAPLAAVVRDALCNDVAAQVASYLMLLHKDAQPETGFPTAYTHVNARMDALRKFGQVTDDILEFRYWSAEVMRRSKLLHRPISYVRSSDFALLADETNHDRLVAWLPLLAADNDIVQPVVGDGRLVDLASGQLWKKRSKIGVLLPIEFGSRDWQQRRFLDALRSGNAAIKSAKLINKVVANEHRYFLNVSLAFETPTTYEPLAYLGVEHNVLFTLATAIVDNTGRISEQWHSDNGLVDLRVAVAAKVKRRQQRAATVTAKDYRGQQMEEMLHVLVNRLVAQALGHRAQIVLAEKPERGAAWIRTAWAKLEEIVGYKAALAGVPLRAGMFRAGAWRICSACGGDGQVERQTGLFSCGECGRVLHSGENTAVNISRRILYKKKEWEERGGYRAFHRTIANT